MTTFFEINLPYGIKRNNDGEWTAFNREYQPLGINSKSTTGSFGYARYSQLSDSVLLKLAVGNIKYDESQRISQIWFYDDTTKPTSSPHNWENYMEKLKLLSKLQIPNEIR